MTETSVAYEWRERFDNAELNALHAEAFDHRLLEDDRWGQVHRHSLGWVCARRDGRLVGFVNVSWGGGVHAFVLDTLVSLDARREGIGKRLVAVAVSDERRAGCEWLHSVRSRLSHHCTEFDRRRLRLTDRRVHRVLLR